MSDLPEDEQLSTLADLEAFLRVRKLRLRVGSASNTTGWQVKITKELIVADEEHEDFVTAIRIACSEAMKTFNN